MNTSIRSIGRFFKVTLQSLRGVTPGRGLLCMVALAPWANGAPAAPLEPAAATPLDDAAPSVNSGNWPLYFEINQGQSDAEVRFLSRGTGYSLFLTDKTAVLALVRPDSARQPDVVRMELPGASRTLRVSGIDPQPGIANYFIGDDPARWHERVPTFAKVKYEGVYPGVDLVYYGNQRQLEYDFVIAPHVDPSIVRMHFAHNAKVRLDPTGDLNIVTAHGAIAFHKPVVYQVQGGARVAVASRFRLLGNGTVGFALEHYDASRQLIIDPTLTYSTYLGGSGFPSGGGYGCCGDFGKAVAVDAQGSVYITGQTGSADFPTTKHAPQTVNGHPDAPGNAFVTKLNAGGTALVYSTYLGGTGNYWWGDAGQAIAVDSAGEAYVGGYTGSGNFPITTGAYQTISKTIGGDAYTGFVTKLDKSGAKLLYSTYLGGSGIPGYTLSSPPGDAVRGLALGSGDTVFVTGTTYSRDFPVSAKAYQRVNNAASIDASNLFVAKLNRAGTELVYSTYLGGKGTPYGFAGGDYGTAIALDSNDEAYVTGYAYSVDFPVTRSAYQSQNLADQSANNTGAANYNVVVSKLNATGSRLVYSTYLGGNGNVFYGDQATGIAVDSSCHAYVTGLAGSADFPVTKQAFQTVFSNQQSFNFNAFLTKLNPTGSALVYSTYLGGSGGNGTFGLGDPVGDYAAGVKVNATGNAIVVGVTQSADFPVTRDAFQPANAQQANANANYYSGNVFLTEFTESGSALVYSTYFGGSGSPTGGGGDSAAGIALDPSGNAYITGHTVSGNLPITAGAFQTQSPAYAAGNHDSGNAFVAKFALGADDAVPQPNATACAPSSD